MAGCCWQLTGVIPIRGLFIMALTIGGMLIASPRATAQNTENADLSIGYLNVMGTMHGTNVQISKPLNQRWTLVGELDFSRGPDPDSEDYIYRDIGILGGIRAGWQTSRRVFPFVQVLGGALHSKAAGDVCYMFGGGCEHSEFAVTYIAFQPGAGVTVMLTPRVGIRIQGDLQAALSPEYASGSLFPRVATGVVVRLGR